MVLYYKRKRRRILTFIVLPLILTSLFFYTYLKVSSSFLELSEDKIYAVCFNLVNNIISTKISEIGSENIIDYKYDNNGNIIAVNANVVTMNILNTSIAEELVSGISALDNLFVEIPLGSFISADLLPAIGPSIPIKILPLSTVHTEYSTEFSSTGINQTQHKIFIKVNCTLKVLSTLAKSTQEINMEIPIAETIIIGDVPNTYISAPNQLTDIHPEQ